MTSYDQQFPGIRPRTAPSQSHQDQQNLPISKNEIPLWLRFLQAPVALDPERLEAIFRDLIAAKRRLSNAKSDESAKE